MTVVFGPLLLILPVRLVRIALGALLLILGFRWLRKAILRATGFIPHRNETLIFVRTEARLQSETRAVGICDWEGTAAAFNGVFVEGLEIIFIVLSLGTAGRAMILTSAGAAGACLCVIGLGFILHRPLARVPENWIKFAVGVLLTSFGLFWTGEALVPTWPGQDLALFGLLAFVSLASWLAVAIGKAWCPK